MLMLPGCLHVYHSECVGQWLVNKSSLCPMCRNDVGPYCRGEKTMAAKFSVELKPAEITQRMSSGKYEWKKLMNGDDDDSIVVMSEKVSGCWLMMLVLHTAPLAPYVAQAMTYSQLTQSRRPYIFALLLPATEGYQLQRRVNFKGGNSCGAASDHPSAEEETGRERTFEH
jgi:hypothetical protein